MISKMGNTVNVNGKVYRGGSSIVVKNNEVWIDGVLQVDGNKIEQKKINITIEGNVGSLDVSTCDTITVNGSIEDLETTSGDVKCNDITGNVQTVSGDVRARNINGKVKTVSGDVSKRFL